MPRYTASLVFTFSLTAGSDEAARVRLEYLSGLARGFLFRNEFQDLWPEYAGEIDLETTDLGGPEDSND